MNVIRDDDIMHHVKYSTYLFVADVLSCEGYWPLHGHDSKHLKQIFTSRVLACSRGNA